jgi:hypothetical protein
MNPTPYLEGRWRAGSDEVGYRALLRLLFQDSPERERGPAATGPLDDIANPVCKPSEPRRV